MEPPRVVIDPDAVKWIIIINSEKYSAFPIWIYDLDDLFSGNNKKKHNIFTSPIRGSLWASFSG